MACANELFRSCRHVHNERELDAPVLSHASFTNVSGVQSPAWHLALPLAMSRVVLCAFRAVRASSNCTRRKQTKGLSSVPPAPPSTHDARVLPQVRALRQRTDRRPHRARTDAQHAGRTPATKTASGGGSRSSHPHSRSSHPHSRSSHPHSRRAPKPQPYTYTQHTHPTAPFMTYHGAPRNLQIEFTSLRDARVWQRLSQSLRTRKMHSRKAPSRDLCVVMFFGQSGCS